MFSRRKGIIIILTVLLSALSIEVLLLLYHRFYGSDFADVLFDIGLTRWGWLPALFLGVSSIALTICWKPGRRMLHGFIISISVLTVIVAALWLLGIYFITHLTP